MIPMEINLMILLFLKYSYFFDKYVMIVQDQSVLITRSGDAEFSKQRCDLSIVTNYRVEKVRADFLLVLKNIR